MDGGCTDHKTIAIRKDNGMIARCAHALLRCAHDWLTHATSVAIDGSKFKAVTTATRTSRAPRWSGGWRRLRRASRAICSSSTLPTARQRPHNQTNRLRDRDAGADASQLLMRCCHLPQSRYHPMPVHAPAPRSASCYTPIVEANHHLSSCMR